MESKPINRSNDTTMKTTLLHGLSLLASLFALTGTTLTAHAADKQPNIVFILTEQSRLRRDWLLRRRRHAWSAHAAH